MEISIYQQYYIFELFETKHETIYIWNFKLFWHRWMWFLKLNIIIIKNYSHHIDEIAADVSNSFVASKTKTKISPSNGALQKQLSLYTWGTRWCNLCQTEKLLIAKAEPKTLLNKRSENIAMWRHRTYVHSETFTLIV